MNIQPLPSVTPLAVSPEDAASVAGVSRGTIYKAMKKGVLRSSKIGSRRLITLDAIKAWLSSCEAPLTSEGV